ncbi:MAG: hypothetical protein HY727_21640 [Candidatus Rokubacteria bacterium]|nr:hypothetical protein [Candidatus Rokubacteria bacterium]
MIASQRHKTLITVLAMTALLTPAALYAGGVEQTGAVIRQIVTEIRREVDGFRGETRGMTSQLKEASQQRRDLERTWERETEHNRKLGLQMELLRATAKEFAVHGEWVTALRGVVSKMHGRFRQLTDALRAQRQALARQEDLPALKRQTAESLAALASILDYWAQNAPPELRKDVAAARSSLAASVPALEASLRSLDVSVGDLGGVLVHLDSMLQRIASTEKQLEAQQDRLLVALGRGAVILAIEEAKRGVLDIPGLFGDPTGDLGGRERALDRLDGGEIASPAQPLPVSQGHEDTWQRIKSGRLRW